ncbi:metal-dependent protein hydrolase, partial [Aureobasidium melanogenum]
MVTRNIRQCPVVVSVGKVPMSCKVEQQHVRRIAVGAFESVIRLKLCSFDRWAFGHVIHREMMVADGTVSAICRTKDHVVLLAEGNSVFVIVKVLVDSSYVNPNGEDLTPGTVGKTHSIRKGGDSWIDAPKVLSVKSSMYVFRRRHRVCSWLLYVAKWNRARERLRLWDSRHHVTPQMLNREKAGCFLTTVRTGRLSPREKGRCDAGWEKRQYFSTSGRSDGSFLPEEGRKFFVAHCWDVSGVLQCKKTRINDGFLIHSYAPQLGSVRICRGLCGCTWSAGADGILYPRRRAWRDFWFYEDAIESRRRLTRMRISINLIQIQGWSLVPGRSSCGCLSDVVGDRGQYDVSSRCCGGLMHSISDERFRGLVYRSPGVHSHMLRGGVMLQPGWSLAFGCLPTLQSSGKELHRGRVTCGRLLGNGLWQREPGVLHRSCIFIDCVPGATAFPNCKGGRLWMAERHDAGFMKYYQPPSLVVLVIVISVSTENYLDVYLTSLSTITRFWNLSSSASDVMESHYLSLQKNCNLCITAMSTSTRLSNVGRMVVLVGSMKGKILVRGRESQILVAEASVGAAEAGGAALLRMKDSPPHILNCRLSMDMLLLPKTTMPLNSLHFALSRSWILLCVGRLLGHLENTLEGLVATNETRGVHEDTAGNTRDLAQLLVSNTLPGIGHVLAVLEAARLAADGADTPFAVGLAAFGEQDVKNGTLGGSLLLESVKVVGPWATLGTVGDNHDATLVVVLEAVTKGLLDDGASRQP